MIELRSGDLRHQKNKRLAWKQIYFFLQNLVAKQAQFMGSIQALLIHKGSETMVIKIKNLGSSILFCATIVLVYPFLGALIILCASRVLNAIVGIGLLPSAMILISILLTGVIAAGFGFTTREIRAFRHAYLENEDSWDDDEFENDDEDKEVDLVLRDLKFKPDAEPALKVGRNQPCPCGSQKKYKACCLNREEALAEDIAF